MIRSGSGSASRHAHPGRCCPRRTAGTCQGAGSLGKEARGPLRPHCWGACLAEAVRVAAGPGPAPHHPPPPAPLLGTAGTEGLCVPQSPQGVGPAPHSWPALSQLGAQGRRRLLRSRAWPGLCSVPAQLSWGSAHTPGRSLVVPAGCFNLTLSCLQPLLSGSQCVSRSQ